MSSAWAKAFPNMSITCTNSMSRGNAIQLLGWNSLSLNSGETLESTNICSFSISHGRREMTCIVSEAAHKSAHLYKMTDITFLQMQGFTFKVGLYGNLSFYLGRMSRIYKKLFVLGSVTSPCRPILKG